MKRQANSIQSVDKRQKFFTAFTRNYAGMLYVCRRDLNWRFIFCSEGCLALTGYTASILQQDVGLLDLIHSDDKDTQQLLRSQRHEVHQRNVSEFRLTRSDGATIWVQDQSWPIISDTGEIEAIEGILTDISSHKEQTQNLLQSQQQLQDLYDHSPDMLLSINPRTTHIINCNQTLLNTLGYYSHEVIGRSALEIYTQESGQRIKTELLPKFTQEGCLEAIELQVKAKNGQIFDVLLSSRAARNAEGLITHSISSWRNITPYKEIQRIQAQNQIRFELLMATLPVPCAINTPDLQISFVNRAFSATFGYSLAEIPDLHHWWTHAYPDASYRNWIQDQWLQRLETAKTQQTQFEPLIAHIHCQNGELKTVLASATPLENNWTGDHLVTLIDLTEQEQQQQELVMREQRFKALFETANLSIWNEDMSGLLDRLDQLRAEGIVDFHHHLEQHNEVLQECIRLFKVTDLNPATEALFQGTKAELLKDISVLFGDGAIDVIKDELMHFWEKKEHFSAEVNLRTLGNHPFRAIISFPIPKTHEAAKNVPVCIQDLSQIQEMQNELAFRGEVLENMHQGVHLVRASDSIIVYANPTLEDMFGYPSNSLIGKHVSVLNPPANTLQEDMAQVILKELELHAHWEGELLNIKLNGETFWTRAAISGFNHKNYGPVWITVQRDISAEHLAKQQRDFSNTQLQAIAHIQGNFIENQDEKAAFDMVLEQICLVSQCQFGFIAEVLLNTDGSPYLRANALSNMAWNQGAHETYQQYIEHGIEFHNLDSVFGIPLRTLEPYISNEASTNSNIYKTPNGHAPIFNFMAIPIFQGSTLIAEIGMANRKEGFNLKLIDELQPFMLTYSQLVMALRSKRESRRAKEELHQRDQLWKTAIEGAGHGVWDWDLKENKLSLTERWAQLLAIDPKTLSNSPDEWLERVHPEDIQPLRAQLKSHLDGQSPSFSAEHRLRSQDNSYKWVLTRGTVVSRTEDGTPSRMIGTTTDISLRKNAEEELLANRAQLAGMIDSAMDAIITTDNQFNIILFNRAAEQMFGYPAYKMLGCPIESLIPSRYAISHRIFMRQFGEKGNQTRKMNGIAARQVCGQRADGSEFPIEVAISFSENYGSPIYTAMVRDITDRKEFEQNLINLTANLEERVQQRTKELETARLLAESANRAKSAFVANMSHEIRTPLNSVLGMAHLALQTDLNEKQRDYLSKISSSGTHLLGLINDILDFSKIEAGKLEIESVEFSLSSLCNELKDLLEPKAFEKHLKFELIIEPDVPKYSKGDALRLKQVLINLLSNAIKFTEQGKIRLHISTMLPPPTSPPRICFTVTDTGIGISPGAQTRLFQSFHQADSSTTRKFGGTGLGLAISRQLIELMGGELTLKSQSGLGSEFSFSLPLPSIIQPSLNENDQDRQSIDYHSTLKGKHILLADDHPFNQQVGEDLLAEVGATVVLANDGREAVELANSQQFDAILMDVQMPEMDGFTASKILRNSTQFDQIPIIAMTANVSNEDRQLCLAAGMNDFISKPVIPEKLYKTLAYWVSGHTENESNENTIKTQNDVLIDYDTLIAMLGPQIERQKKYFAKFVSATHEGLEKISSLSNEGGIQQIAAECHRLKSIARTVGAIELANSLNQLENDSRDSSSPFLKEKIKGLNDIFEQTCQHLFDQQLIESSPVTLKSSSTMPLLDHNLRIMLIDDDEFTLDIISQHLADLQLTHVTTCLDGNAALAQLEQQELPDWILCDLQMPDLDGIAFLRLLGQKNYRGQVAILSGMDNTVLKATEKLGQAFMLNIHGALSKPVKREDLARLLSEATLENTIKPIGKPAEDHLDANELQRGLAHGAVELFYQPKVSTLDRRVVGAECLARWRHPTRGLLGPGQFISAIETLGLVDDLTFNVLRQAVRQIKSWQEQGEHIKLSVNVSMDNLHRLELPELFSAVLEESGVAAQSITLEITETQLSHDYVLSLDILTRLRIKGFGLSIDDFGTGFSTMEHLLQTPFTELKIDQAFVRGASNNKSAQTILEHSVMLGSKFKLNLVAEGVETQEDWDLVVSVGCHEVQGYLVAKPMPADEFIAWKKQWEFNKN